MPLFHSHSLYLLNGLIKVLPLTAHFMAQETEVQFLPLFQRQSHSHTAGSSEAPKLRVSPRHVNRDFRGSWDRCGEPQSLRPLRGKAGGPLSGLSHGCCQFSQTAWARSAVTPHGAETLAKTKAHRVVFSGDVQSLVFSVCRWFLHFGNFFPLKGGF